MEKLRITVEEAHIQGGCVRLPTEEGRASIYVMEGCFYEADGTDDAGESYTIYWRTLDGFDPNTDDECDACDWKNPAAVVLTDDWKLVTRPLELLWG